VASAFIAVLIVVVASHVLPELSRMRDYGWLGSWLESAARGLGTNPFYTGATGVLLSLGLPLLAVALMQWLLRGHWFGLASFSFALVALYYAWGPRDLDLDVDTAVAATDPAARAEALAALGGSAGSGHDGAVGTVMNAGLARWFGVLFWFVLLGAVGAVGYRLVCTLARDPAYAGHLPQGQRTLLARLAQVLDWPVAHLVTLALAVAADFDRVAQAWRDWHAVDREDALDVGFVTHATIALVREAEAEDGQEGSPDVVSIALQQAMALCWRVLVVWLVVLALMVLAGFIG